MKNMSISGLLVIVAILAVVAFVLLAFSAAPRVAISNFDECAAAGYPIMESYPEQCRTPDGQTFVRQIPQSNETSNGGGLGLQANGCAVAGCSGQLCVSADEAGNIVTTCEFRSEFACYREASCEPQSDGKCGWTMSGDLQACLSNPPPLE